MPKTKKVRLLIHLKRLSLMVLSAILFIQIFAVLVPPSQAYAINKYEDSTPLTTKYRMYTLARAMYLCYKSGAGLHNGPEMSELGGGNIFDLPGDYKVALYGALNDEIDKDSSVLITCNGNSNALAKKFFSEFGISGRPAILGFLCSMGYTRSGVACDTDSDNGGLSFDGDDDLQSQLFSDRVSVLTGLDITNPSSEVLYVSAKTALIEHCAVGTATITQSQYDQTDDNLRYRINTYNSSLKKTEYLLYAANNGKSSTSHYDYEYLSTEKYEKKNPPPGAPETGDSGTAKYDCGDLEAQVNNTFNSYMSYLVNQAEDKCQEKYNYTLASQRLGCAYGAVYGQSWCNTLSTAASSNQGISFGIINISADIVKSAAEKCSDGSGVILESSDVEFNSALSGQEITGENDEVNSCPVDGIGWIVCPVMSAISTMNDAMFSIVENILQMNPIQMYEADGVTQTSSYKIWQPIRDIANVLLVVAFIIIIFSQITSIGIDNYGIKKLLPKIVLSAIAINLSYFVIMLGVDIVNVLGSTLHDLINGLLPLANTVSGYEPTWTGLISLVGIGGTVAIIGVNIGGAALALMILPFLITGALALLAAFLTLAIRNALVLILCIVAPVAFAAYLLPNTKSLFDKWRKLLTSMLFLYPMAALLFAGAKLAGTILINTQSDDDFQNGINLMLGLTITAAPLFMLPWLAKSSGGILAKIGGSLSSLANKGSQAIKKNAIDDPYEKRKAQYRANQNRFAGFGKARVNPDRQKLLDELGGITGDTDEDKRRRKEITDKLSRTPERARGRRSIGSRIENMSRSTKAETEYAKTAQQENWRSLGTQEFTPGSGKLDRLYRNRQNQSEASRISSVMSAQETLEQRKSATDARRREIVSQSIATPGTESQMYDTAKRLSETRTKVTDAEASGRFEIDNEAEVIRAKAAERQLKETEAKTQKRIDQLSSKEGAEYVIDHSPEHERETLRAAAESLQKSTIDAAVTSSATDAAKRLQTEEVAEAMKDVESGRFDDDGKPIMVRSATAVAAGGAGSDKTRAKATTRAQAKAVSDVSALEDTNIKAAETMFKERYGPDELAGDSGVRNDLARAVEENDPEIALAAAKTLQGAGEKGRSTLQDTFDSVEQRILAMPDGDEKDAQLKTLQILKKANLGTKENDAVLDAHAVDPRRRSLREQRNDPAVLGSLKSIQLVRQVAKNIEYAARHRAEFGFNADGSERADYVPLVTTDQAKAIVENQAAFGQDLDPAKLLYFKVLAGMEPPSSLPPKSLPEDYFATK